MTGIRRLMRTFVMKTSSTNDENNPSEACVVHMAEDEARDLLKRRASFLAIRAYDRQVRRIEYWSSAAVFAVSKDREKDLWDVVFEKSGIPATELDERGYAAFGYDEVDHEPVPMDRSIGKVYVGEEGVHWKAPDKGDRFILSTTDLPWEEIERLANKEDALDTPVPGPVMVDFPDPEKPGEFTALGPMDRGTAVEYVKQWGGDGEGRVSFISPLPVESGSED